MNDVQKLLDEISHLVDVDKKLKEEKRVRGEMFNIFSVLGVTVDEVRLHSTFLATLLNPKADHGQGSNFLKAFAERFGFPLDSTSAQIKVEVEKDIGRVNDDRGGRIDILVSDGPRCIIIENKIYAGDQPKQLTRYWNYAKENFGSGNYRLVYLTLDGHEPSDDSTEGMPDKSENEPAEYICLSYKDDILHWLEKCVALSVRQPLIRETLNQYIGVVRRLTYCDMENKDELVKMMTEHLDAVFKIEYNLPAMYNNIMNHVFRSQLEELARVKGMTLVFPEGADWASMKSLGWRFRLHEWNHFDIAMEFQGKALKNLLMGFVLRENLKPADIACWKKLQEIVHTANTENKLWIFRWFDERRDWSNLDTMKAIMDGQTMKELIEKKLDEFLGYAEGLDV